MQSDSMEWSWIQQRDQHLLFRTLNKKSLLLAWAVGSIAGVEVLSIYLHKHAPDRIRLNMGGMNMAPYSAATDLDLSKQAS